MPLIFSQFNNAPSAPTATYYAHVVTTIPTGAETIVSALALANPSGYTPKSIVVNTVVNSGITNWTFNEVVWSPLSWDVSVCGTVIVLQTGTSRNAAVDRPFLFYEFENGIQSPIVLTPGYFGLKFNSGLSFAFSTQAANKYDVGSFVGLPLYKDLLTLLNSNNGTRYTPVSGYIANQFYSSQYNIPFNTDFKCYWIGDRVMIRELQNRHDIAYNNVTFPILPSPILGFSRAATFNGIDSYVTIGNTTQNGSDFMVNNGGGFEPGFLIYFFPTLNATEEILLDTTTSNNSSGYILRKTVANNIEIGFISAGTPHTIILGTTTNTVNIDAWNFVMISSYANNRALWLNNVVTQPYINFNDSGPPNGFRLGARRGLNASFTGVNFTGKILYSAHGGMYKISDLCPVINNRDIQAPYNQSYAQGWSQTGLNTNVEMTTANSFPANKSTFIRSIGNLDTYVGAQNIFYSNDSSHFRIDSPNCFYINFGQNKVRPGTVAIMFRADVNYTDWVKLGLPTSNNGAVFCIWGTNTLPGNTPTNSNLSNPALWDKFEYTIPGINNTSIPSPDGSGSDYSGMTLVTSGGYKYYILNTDITKYFKYMKFGWRDAVAGSPYYSYTLPAYYLLYNSSVLSPSIDLVPPTAGYAA